LKPELFLLLDYLDQNPIVEELGIITNGLSIDKKIVERFSTFSKLKKVKISLDGSDADTNDSIRQKGTFDKVLQSLALINKEKRFEIILMFTAMKRNYKDFPSFIRLCQDLGMNGLILERFIPLGKGKGIMGEVLEKDQWRELMETLLEFFSSEIEERELLPYQALQMIFTGDEAELLGAPCIVGRDGICVMPEGTVFPCRRFPVSIGDLLKISLKEIWEKSEILEQLRRKENLKGRCGRCEMKDCRGCRSLALSLKGDYLEDDPHCWYDSTT